MSEYEELRERVRLIVLSQDPSRYRAEGILAEVFRTLEKVTPEMAAASHVIDFDSDEAIFLAMLRASPLAPPKDNEHG